MDWHRNSPGGRGRAFPGLKPIIFDDCDEIDPLPVLIPVPRGDAVRFGLFDDGAQHRFQQPIRFRLLPERADSEWSWTVDFAAGLQAALAEAHPFREKAAEFNALANGLDDEIMALRKKDPPPREEIEKTKERWKNALRDAREAQAKATAIENAVYDLKAVNPHRIVVEDKRTPLEIIETIRAKDREATAALSRLQQLLVADNSLTRSN